jgi:hypothetical protein
MNRTILKRIALTLLVTLCVCLGILGTHIYQVTHKSSPVIQLSRIDFLQPIDSTEATAIRYKVAALPGIESTYFNYTNHILVYTFNTQKQSSDAVFATVTSDRKYKAQKYTVSAADLATGCPVGADKSSVSGKTIAFLTSLFRSN